MAALGKNASDGSMGRSDTWRGVSGPAEGREGLKRKETHIGEPECRLLRKMFQRPRPRLGILESKVPQTT